MILFQLDFDIQIIPYVNGLLDSQLGSGIAVNIIEVPFYLVEMVGGCHLHVGGKELPLVKTVNDIRYRNAGNVVEIFGALIVTNVAFAISWKSRTSSIDVPQRIPEKPCITSSAIAIGAIPKQSSIANKVINFLISKFLPTVQRRIEK